MVPKKVAILLLLVLAIICLHQVAGDCTKDQKDLILQKCKGYVMNRDNRHIIEPSNGSLCCKEVRKVPEMDMKCIVDLLTPLEKTKYNGTRILSLEQPCKVTDTTTPPSPPRQSWCSRTVTADGVIEDTSAG
ncbi:hypothetical protein ACP4OV_010323 [Aristida adscensionis]